MWRRAYLTCAGNLTKLHCKNKESLGQDKRMWSSVLTMHLFPMTYDLTGHEVKSLTAREHTSHSILQTCSVVSPVYLLGVGPPRAPTGKQKKKQLQVLSHKVLLSSVKRARSLFSISLHKRVSMPPVIFWRSSHAGGKKKKQLFYKLIFHVGRRLTCFDFTP